MNEYILLFFTECYLKMAIPLGVSFAADWILNFYISASSFCAFLILKLIFIVFVLHFAMWFLGFGNGEKII
jgi:hypothetical protein